METIDFFLSHLEGVEWDERTQTGMAYCPCHDDVGTSMKGLSYSVTSNGKILMFCHSCGATLPAVFEKLNSENGSEPEEPVGNLVRRKNGATPTASSRPGMQWWIEKTGVPEHVWAELGCVEDGNGVTFLFDTFSVRKIRKPPKEFLWVGTKTEDRPPLWPVPNDDLPKHIWITEGESDCGTAAAAGHYAFAITAGAGRGDKRYLPRNAFEALMERGAEEITICGDIDESGIEFAEQMSHAAVDAGMTVNVVRLDLVIDPFAGINDLNAVFRAAETIEEFNDLVTRATQRVATRYPTLTLEDMMALAKEEIPWLLPGLIAPSDKVILSAPQKSYKTWITLDLMRSLVDCKPFMGREEWIPKESVRCLFVEEEGSKALWAQRIERLGIDNGENIFFLHRAGIRFKEKDTIDELIGLCRAKQIQFLALDPLQRMTAGIDENSSSEMGIVWDEIFRLQFAVPGLVVMVIHHSNKAERLSWDSMRGTSRNAGEVDLGIFMETHPTETEVVRVRVDGRDIPRYMGTGEVFEAKVFISSEGEPPELRVDANEMTVQVNLKPTVAGRNRMTVIEALEEGANTLQAIVSICELSETSVRKHLRTMVEDGIVTETDHGHKKAATYTLNREDEE